MHSISCKIWRTSVTFRLSLGGVLRWIGLVRSWMHRWAAILFRGWDKATITGYKSVRTHAGVEREIRERAVREQTIFVLRNSVAYLGIRVHLWCRTFERGEVAELRYRDWVSYPFQELKVRNDPYLGAIVSLLPSTMEKWIYRSVAAVPSPRKRWPCWSLKLAHWHRDTFSAPKLDESQNMLGIKPTDKWIGWVYSPIGWRFPL